MVQIFKINGLDIINKVDLTFFKKKKFYGTNDFYLNNFKTRFELNTMSFFGYFLEYEKFKYVLYKYIRYIFPVNKLLKNNALIAIIFLNILNVYKGWRHLKGLPCRGQRTWSNAWSSFRSNFSLRFYKKFIYKRFYGKLGAPEQQISVLSEYLNFLWKTQWFSEWLFSRRYIRAVIKKKRTKLNIDLTATSKGYLGNLRKNNPKLGKKKKKMLTGLIGFDQGFTKIYLRMKYEVDIKLRKKAKKRKYLKRKNKKKSI